MKNLIKTIGQQLDMDIIPNVRNRGIVTPSHAAAQKSTWAKEKDHERSAGQERSATAAWRRPEGRERAADGARPPSEAAPVICTSFKDLYERQLDAVREAYPGTRVWPQKDGMWLLSESSLLPGLWQKAVFLTGIPFAPTLAARSWGFWSGPPRSVPDWIGPRHTNFTDGSICAFDPTDGVWKVGDPIIELLDLYSVWAFRHLHLQVLRRWPGRQVAHHPYERVTELREDEYCGCAESDRLYGECCIESDKSRNRLDDFISFQIIYGETRRPPASVVDFFQNEKHPPNITDLLPSMYNMLGVPQTSAAPALATFTKSRRR